MLALTVANDTLVGVALVVVIVAGLMFIFGRAWHR
jgi:type IV secretory pathway VirB2 component (pilin)